jgi:hypothetical protein
MNSKTLLLALVLVLIIPNIVLTQNTGETTQELKKAEDVVKAGKSLVNIFKKKKKSKKKEAESNDNGSNDENGNPAMKNEENSNSEVSNQEHNEIPLTEEAAILFKNCKSMTTNAEKNEITAFMNIKAAPDGKQFYINDQYSKDYTFTVEVYPIDINHDSVEEIALVYGHPAISGDNVISTLFIKDDQGHYSANFGFSGSLIILPNSSKGFPDIALGGPGFEFPVWRWDGKNYTDYGTITNDKLEKSQPLFLEEASKLYVESISN